jgi:hypothetical protein
MNRIASGSILSQCWGCDADDGGENSRDEQRKPHGYLLLAFAENLSTAILFPARCVTRRPKQSYRYVRWTFFKALAVVIVGVIGVLATLFQ